MTTRNQSQEPETPSGTAVLTDRAPAGTTSPMESMVDTSDTMDVSFIRWVPALTKEPVAITVLPLDRNLVGYWQSCVQPIIDEDPKRTDRGWRWTRIWAATNVMGALQRPKGFAACVTTPSGDQIPCAMVQLVARYPALDDRTAKGVFLWFLADAPVRALQQLAPDALIPKMLGTIALDIAVTFSFNDGMAGRTGLHADSRGGDGLARWYISKGMTNLPVNAPRPSLFRSNDGRYFYYTPSAALEARCKLDQFRALGRS